MAKYETDLKAELGDVLWYVSELCTTIGCTLGEVMHGNIEKLEARKAANTIKGTGDDR